MRKFDSKPGTGGVWWSSIPIGHPEGRLGGAPTETEIKLLFDPGARPALEQNCAFAHAARADPPRREVTTYYDTDALTLHRHGYSLRIREAGDCLVQTLKKTAADAAAHQRNQWEWKLARRRLTLRPLSRALAGNLQIDSELRGAKPKFVSEILRRRFDIPLGGSRIEAVIDEGVIKAGNREERVCEIELEIKDGPPGPALRLALDLLEHNPVWLGAESKADRGYRLLTGALSPPTKARAASLTPGASVGEALNRTAGAALQAFTANMPAARRGDPEGVHQMRVALRRLRSMLVLFAPCLDSWARRRFDDSIRDLGEVLGAARDWDVFVAETLRDALGDGVRAEWIAAAEEHAIAKRENARRNVQALLDGKSPGELVLGVEAWLADPEWAAECAKSAREPVTDVLPGLLDRVADKVARRGRRATKLAPKKLHPLRKSIRKLRYSAESVAELYRGKPVKRYIKNCKTLQTVLGTINDSRATAHLVDELAPGHSAAWAPAAGALSKWNAERLKEARQDLGKAWRKLRRSDRFWR
ncbi:MAG TPA: CYTH and CHAD domain-containing protein [Rhizomicrobium sp.]